MSVLKSISEVCLGTDGIGDAKIWKERKLKLAHFGDHELKTTQSGPEFLVTSGNSKIDSEESLGSTKKGFKTFRAKIEVVCGDCETETEMLRLDLEDDSPKSTHHCNSTSSDTCDTYRCESSNFDSLPRQSSRIEKRCKIVVMDQSDKSKFLPEQENMKRYTLNKRKVARISTLLKSLPETSEKLNGEPILRKMSYDAWLQQKIEESQKKRNQEYREKIEKKEREKQIQRGKEERAFREKENFMKWTKNKQKEDVARKVKIGKSLETLKQLENFKDEISEIKNIQLHVWLRKKESQQKDLKRELQRVQKEQEKKKLERLKNNVEAFQKWQEKSRHTPKPATQTHSHVKPVFFNPNPWQGINVDNDMERLSKS